MCVFPPVRWDFFLLKNLVPEARVRLTCACKPGSSLTTLLGPSWPYAPHCLSTFQASCAFLCKSFPGGFRILQQWCVIRRWAALLAVFQPQWHHLKSFVSVLTCPCLGSAQTLLGLACAFCFNLVASCAALLARLPFHCVLCCILQALSVPVIVLSFIVLCLHFQRLISSSFLSLLWVWPRTSVNPCTTNPLLVCAPHCSEQPWGDPREQISEPPRAHSHGRCRHQQRQRRGPPSPLPGRAPKHGHSTSEGHQGSPQLREASNGHQQEQKTASQGRSGRHLSLDLERETELRAYDRSNSWELQERRTAGREKERRLLSPDLELEHGLTEEEQHSRKPRRQGREKHLPLLELELEAQQDTWHRGGRQHPEKHRSHHQGHSSHRMACDEKLYDAESRDDHRRGEARAYKGAGHRRHSPSPHAVSQGKVGDCQRDPGNQVMGKVCLYVGMDLCVPHTGVWDMFGFLEDASLQYLPAMFMQGILPGFLPDLAGLFLSINVLALYADVPWHWRGWVRRYCWKLCPWYLFV